MLNQKEEIINAAQELFIHQGNMKVTMDEIAGQIKISKKTIYKFFPNKAELLTALIDVFTKSIYSEVKDLITADVNSIEKLYGFNRALAKKLSVLHVNWLNNVAVHHPYLWRQVENFRSKMIRKNLGAIIEQGKNEGLIKNLPKELMLALILSTIQSVVNPQFMIQNNLPPKDTLNNTLDILICGIATQEGLKVLKKLKGAK